ncbi:MAG: phosphoribosylaminoimidazolesuccinocarboxamide synthase [Ignavibacteria bacterium CG_4_8_14_3_um_filter_37_9]|nr:phosphoribosylaminoimidazolesuccinocarboxamide synthase [Ignavibacteria bacterium]OIO14068.1 MAG: phosphoribosylaminoimidazolesuccinocarboxamide synthase [Ignavibacteria bacterium CG1_02_37_35]PIW99019.1 MAG: phosphoribosylaminoimidazolesuccinocarboxamide synthase [Ignavibacteria bacterium CG_4_8_14_3_um_filter_37_9]
MNETILKTNFSGMSEPKRGKVRDIYEVDDKLLIVSTDRLSAFDVIMNQGIPQKGIVLNTISSFWFRMTEAIIPNHLISINVDEFPSVCEPHKESLRGRSMLVKKTKVVPIEAIVRGYLSGSGWNEYQKTGEVCSIKLPKGLVESEKLPRPIFTPSTKAEIGTHDENISFDQAGGIAGADIIDKMKTAAINIFNTCAEYALKKGIIIADTKMEFGLDEKNNLILIDELLTPDSSRFWQTSTYAKGKSQQSFDKQFVRDFLLSIKFNKQPPPPDLPEDVITMTSKKYIQAVKILTGIDL